MSSRGKQFSILNRTRQHWDTRRYGTGSGSDPRAGGEGASMARGSLPLPVPYQCFGLNGCGDADAAGNAAAAGPVRSRSRSES